MWLLGLVVVVIVAGFKNRCAVGRLLTVGTVGVFLVFSQREFRLWLLAATPSRVIFFCVSLLVSVSLLSLVWRLSRHEAARSWFAILAIIAAAIPAGRLVWIATTAHTAAVDTSLSWADPVGASRPGFDARTRRNVYYVIVDGYAGRGSLKRNQVADIGPFLEEMRGTGYDLMDSARTNYVTTFLSIMATLQMDYVVTEQSGRFSDRSGLFPNALENGAVPRVISEVRATGYDFFFAVPRDTACQTRLEINCLNGISDLGAYWQVAQAFLASTKIPQMARMLSGHASMSSDAIAALSASMDSLIRRGRPFFAFAHNMSPHPPYRRADCSVLPDADREADGQQIGRREYYGNAIRCVNAEILALAHSIHDRDPEAIVVFQSDHGSDFDVDWSRPIQSWSDAAIDERSDILNLIHMPEPCRGWVRPGLSQINTMRLVVACLQGRPPVYVEDRTFLNVYEQNPDFGLVCEVTGRLHKPQE
ncbi:MAG: sulfatase-like hydrolase/transferase [Acidobacteria bacterium]|nr:sulfatase-like hydrolase/transferase [Acidobacteriota bacterium]